MNVISYSLFGTKNIQQRLHRDWDIYRQEEDRYWYNIPAIYIINSIIYDDFVMKLYVSENISEHRLYPLLKELNKRDNFFLYKTDISYTNTEPTMWRMIPLWDKETDILLCRDIDSLPTINEVKATKTFIDSNYLIHTMRTHRNHNSNPTRILAGLCGFKKEVLKEVININNFSDYYKYSSGGWGCDQNTLISIFYNQVKDKKKYFMDSPIKTETHNVIGNPETSTIDYNLNNYNHEVLNFIDSYTIWSGEPIDFRKDKLKKLLEFDYKECSFIIDIIQNNDELKNFYL